MNIFNDCYKNSLYYNIKKELQKYLKYQITFNNKL